MSGPATLWEILVPKGIHPYGRCWPLEHHQKWDDYVDSISGGLTVMKLSRGSWRDETGGRVKEEMIPVRIACSADQIETIAKFTKYHYDQEKVMYFKLSDEVHFV